jgi:anti-sigma B factor antagonist
MMSKMRELEIGRESLSQRRAVLALQGRLDALTALELKEAIAERVDAGQIELVVDLSGVPFIDSSGLAALVSGFKAARQAGGSLKLAGLNEQALTVLRLTKLDRVFALYADRAAALGALRED